MSLKIRSFRFLVSCALSLVFVGSFINTSQAFSVTYSEGKKPAASTGAPPAQSQDLYGNSYALIIGNNEYVNGWPRLSKAVEDAEQIAAELELRGFEVTLRTNLKFSEMEQLFKEFFVIKGEEPNSRLFVWYAGHGHTMDGEGFLVPVDAPLPSKVTQFRLTALPIRRFGEYVRLAQAKHVFSVFDSCFAGTVFSSQRSIPNPVITRATTYPVRQFLTSGDANQQVSDDGNFRELFIDALHGVEQADLNGDNFLTGSELSWFLSDRVTNLTEANQTPKYGKLRDKDYDRGDFVFQVASAGSLPVVSKPVVKAPIAKPAAPAKKPYEEEAEAQQTAAAAPVPAPKPKLKPYEEEAAAAEQKQAVQQQASAPPPPPAEEEESILSSISGAVAAAVSQASGGQMPSLDTPKPTLPSIDTASLSGGQLAKPEIPTEIPSTGDMTELRRKILEGTKDLVKEKSTDEVKKTLKDKVKSAVQSGTASAPKTASLPSVPDTTAAKKTNLQTSSAQTYRLVSLDAVGRLKTKTKLLESPSDMAETMKSVRRGQLVNVLAKTADGEWLKIEAGGSVGFVLAELVAKERGVKKPKGLDEDIFSKPRKKKKGLDDFSN